MVGDFQRERKEKKHLHIYTKSNYIQYMQKKNFYNPLFCPAMDKNKVLPTFNGDQLQTQNADKRGRGDNKLIKARAFRGENEGRKKLCWVSWNEVATAPPQKTSRPPAQTSTKKRSLKTTPDFSLPPPNCKRPAYRISPTTPKPTTAPIPPKNRGPIILGAAVPVNGIGDAAVPVIVVLGPADGTTAPPVPEPEGSDGAEATVVALLLIVDDGGGAKAMSPRGSVLAVGF